MKNNPFAVEHPENLKIEEVRKLFVEDATNIKNLMSQDHTIIWGARGSGKSMVLRYLEAIDFINDSTKNNKFISIYIPIKEGMFNKSDFEQIPEKFSSVLSEHLFNMYIAQKTINIIQNYIKTYQCIGLSEIEEYVQDIEELFGYLSLIDTLEIIDNFNVRPVGLELLKRIFCIEVSKVKDYLDAVTFEEDKQYKGATTGYLDFLLPFMRRTLKLINVENLKFYLLLDDTGRMHEFQQKIINGWIANRDQSILCVKISTVKSDYKTFMTGNNWKIETPHDYSELETDDVYTSQGTEYYKKLKLICNRRLELAEINGIDITEYLPPDDKQQSMLNDIRKNYENCNQDSLEDLISHELFCKIGNGSRNYAGFDNLVCISSGVIREFLQPCQVMYNKALEQSEDGIIKSIPSSIQNDVITDFAKNYLNKIEIIKRDVELEEHSIVDLLKTFIQTIGELFYNRLKDKDKIEKRIFTFIIKDSKNLSDEYNKMLEFGVSYGYLKKVSSSSKQGGGSYPRYILSRRLAPAFKIDPTSIKGKIELSSNDVELACIKPLQFLSKKLGENTDIKEVKSEQLRFY